MKCQYKYCCNDALYHVTDNTGNSYHYCRVHIAQLGFIEERSLVAENSNDLKVKLDAIQAGHMPPKCNLHNVKEFIGIVSDPLSLWRMYGVVAFRSNSGELCVVYPEEEFSASKFSEMRFVINIRLDVFVALRDDIIKCVESRIEFQL